MKKLLKIQKWSMLIDQCTMKDWLMVNVIILCCSTLGAQSNYSYVSDRIFNDPADLIGFNFCPAIMEIPEDDKKEISPGEYSFGITQNNLYVEGEEIRGVYNVNNTHPTEYGYKMRLMNARNPEIQGHLKIILNNKNQVDVLVFKRSQKEKEILFFQAQLQKELGEKETNYFTDKGEVLLESVDSIWGMKVYPFLKLHTDKGIQQRLQTADSTSISFVEEIRIVEKIKKKKEKKSKKKNKKQEMVVDSVDMTELAMPIDSLQADTANFIKKIKIIKEYFVIVRAILNYDDGTTEDKTWKYPIHKTMEREDKEAQGNEERFQIEFSNKKDVPLFLYLTANRQINSIEIGNQHYLMRGH